jgi:hypothetical protein
MLSKFQKSFFEDTKRGRSILKDAVDLQVQVADHHPNIAGIGIRQHPVNVAGIWRQNPATFAGIRSIQIPATNLAGIWSDRPESGHLAGNWPSDRIWPERPDPGWPDGTGLPAGIRPLSPESGYPRF